METTLPSLGFVLRLSTFSCCFFFFSFFFAIIRLPPLLFFALAKAIFIFINKSLRKNEIGLRKLVYKTWRKITVSRTETREQNYKQQRQQQHAQQHRHNNNKYRNNNNVKEKNDKPLGKER